MGNAGNDFLQTHRALVLQAGFGDNKTVQSANVAIHESQFPDAVQRDLVQSLRSRQINHKFHYDSVKQTQKWLALHQIYSPSRNDADCAATYDRGFEAAAAVIKTKSIHLIGLGCGGGQKDTRLLRLLKARDKKVFYTPCDVSTAMVLTARQAALAVLAERDCFPLVCDLAATADLPNAVSSRTTHHAPRLFTFFGMIPNFEPDTILPKLASLVRPKDTLLFSANLAPGTDYAAGVRTILPQYDNPPTRDWLLTFLLDLGVENSDGKLIFAIETVKGLKRVAAYFQFKRSREIGIGTETFRFKAGEKIRLFFSYRYTPRLIRQRSERHGLIVLNEWVTASAEEGVFLFRRR